nr:MAG TPA: hypothetical protein [Caudoviricetes sp.]
MIAQVCPSVNSNARIYYIFARNCYKKPHAKACGFLILQYR